MRFERAEWFLLTLIALLLALCASIAALKQVGIDYPAYSYHLVLSAAFIGLGQFYRRARIHPPIATATTAIGLMLISGQVMRLFNFVLLPYQFPPVDLLLAEVDGALGFHWSSYARMMAEFPSLSSLLFFVYTTSYWQMVALIFLLGLFGKTTSIKQFMLANIIGGLLTTLIWFFLPSSTPAAFQPLPDGIDKQLDLFLNGEYGRWLVRIGQDGLSYLSPEVMGGIVGFPSFHTVMAIIIVRYSREVPYAVIPFGILNALMFPAILLHGAHNLVDVFGGLAVVWAAIWMAETITDAQPQNRKSSSARWLKPKNLAITKPSSPFAETAMAQMSEIGGVRM